MRRKNTQGFKRTMSVLLATVMVATAVPVSACAEVKLYQRISDYKEMAKLNVAELTIYAGETFQLKLDGAKASSWHSSNSKWATVDENGLVTGKAAGEVNVVAIVSKTESYLCRVTIKNPDLNRTRSTMYVGNTQTLVLNGAKAKSWKSSNTKVAKINQKGKITALASGTTTITCKDINNRRYTCELNVIKKSGNGGATPEEIAKQIPYTINKVYDEDTKIFMYYATNGAYGEVVDYFEWSNVLQDRYPGCTTGWELHCEIQYCDGAAAGNWAGYSIYYVEFYVKEMGEPTVNLDEYYVVDFSHGDNISNYFDAEERKKVVRIGTTKFPKLYKYLGVYDLNGDSYLSKGEIALITLLEIDDAISDLTGIEYLTSLYSVTLSNFIGTKIVLGAANKNLKSLQVTCNTASFTVDAPYLDRLLTHIYFGVPNGGVRSDGTPYIDVSSCTAATSILLQNSNVKTLKLPKTSTALKELKIWHSEITSLNLKKYKNLESISLKSNEKLTKLDLTSNKKLKSVWSGWNTSLKKSNILLPEGVEVEMTYK